jgi:hypothetical protein
MLAITMHAAVNSTLTPLLKHTSSTIDMVRRVRSRESSIPATLQDRVAIMWMTANICIMELVLNDFIGLAFKLCEFSDFSVKYTHMMRPGRKNSAPGPSRFLCISSC